MESECVPVTAGTGYLPFLKNTPLIKSVVLVSYYMSNTVR